MRARRIGASLTVLAMLACVVPAIVIPIVHARLMGLFGPDLGAAITFSFVGAFLLLRGAVTNIAVIICIQGVGAATTSLLGVLAHLGPAHGRISGLPLWAGFLNNYAWLPGVVLLTPLVLLFPNGTLAGPRWRWPIRIVVTLAATYVILATIAKASIVDGRSYADAPSPSGFVRVPLAVQNAAGTLIFAGFIGCLFLSIGSLVARRRRAAGVERAQLTSLLYGATLTVVLLFALDFGNGTSWISFALGLVTVAPVSVGIAVAVLRYRLYEIDKVVSRTVTYVLVLAVLAGVYVGVLAAAANLVSSGQSQLGVALATLLVSILAVPLTRRVRRVVDRRFNRARFDAERVVTSFAQRLRARPERGDVPTDLLAVVERTVAPSHAGIWVARS
ncbi:hypothetical protein [uncultured Jatrophihabitans sp.]|uniref:hypothetical protein n=1 Tax=uncultured Jatrophihabitans sp. TaxID=1610747 RepID=UPI0035CB965F